MTKFTTKTKILALALTTCSVLALGSAAEAETVTSTATVTVNNAIGFAENKTLSFGEIVAQGDGTGAGAAATITVDVTADNTSVKSADGVAVDDRIVVITAGDRAQYDITGAAASTVLNVTIPTTALALSCGTCSGAEPDFSVNTWVDNSAGGPGGTLTTDPAGIATLFVAATLSTDPASLTPYEDGDYTGDYDVTVSY